LNRLRSHQQFAPARPSLRIVHRVNDRKIPAIKPSWTAAYDSGNAAP
jgi:hypothetical protein